MTTCPCGPCATGNTHTVLLAMHDPAGRRGLWYYEHHDLSIQLYAGREGRDATVTIAGSPELRDVLDYARAAFDGRNEGSDALALALELLSLIGEENVRALVTHARQEAR